MNNVFLGTYGEVLALKHLEGEGYKILATNEKNQGGEIDIIARRDDIVIFVEVKARDNEKYGLPIEAVTIAKAKRYIRASKIYIARHKLYDVAIRYDVVTILREELEHIEGAFDASVMYYR